MISFPFRCRQTIKCRAAVLPRESQPLEIRDVLIEAPKANQVRIRMVSAGICASDGHFVWGEQKIDEFPSHSVPAVLGHEGAGIVESCGPNVASLKPGDHVLANLLPLCKQCAYCQNPLTNLCMRDNFGTLGAMVTKRLADDGTPLCSLGGLGIFSEYVLLNENQAIKVGVQVDTCFSL